MRKVDNKLVRKVLILFLLIFGLCNIEGALSSPFPLPLFPQTASVSKSGKPYLAILPVLAQEANNKSYAETLSKSFYIAGKRVRAFAQVDKSLIAKGAGSLTDYSDTGKIASLGKQWQANYVLAPVLKEVTFSEKGDRVTIVVSATAVDPKSESLVYKAEQAVVDGGFGYKGSKEALLQTAFNKLVNNLMNDFISSVSTMYMVISFREGQVTVNAGQRAALKKGVEFLVWKEGEPFMQLGNCKIGIGSSTCDVIAIYIPGEKPTVGDDVTLFFNPSVAQVKKAAEKRRVRKSKVWLYALIGAAVVGGVLALGGKKKRGETLAISNVKIPTSTGTGTQQGGSGVGTVNVVTATPTKTTAGDIAIKVDWPTSSDPVVAGYFVFRASGNDSGPLEAFKLIVDTQNLVGVPPYTDTGADLAKAFRKFRPTNRFFSRSKLTDGVTYWYRVAAHDAQGNQGPISAISSAASAVAGELPPPDAPTLSKATAGGSKVTLEWDPPTTRDDGTTLDPDSELDGYNVYLSSDGGLTFALESFQAHTLCQGASPCTQTRTVTSLTNGVTYYFEIGAVDKDGRNSTVSNQKVATPQAAPAPQPPANLAANASDSTVQLTWDNSTTYITTNGVVKYKVYRGTDGETFTSIATRTAGNLSDPAVYDDNTVTNGTTYFYTVAAVNDEGTEGSQSSAVEATPETTEAPLPPTNLQVDTSAPTDQQITILWDIGNLDVIGTYNLYRSSVSLSDLFTSINAKTAYQSFTVSADTVGTATQYRFTDISLTNGTTYYYAVTAVSKKNGKESNPSNSLSFVPKGSEVPDQVQWDVDNAVDAAGDSVVLNWQPVAQEATGQVSGYCIYRKDVTNGGSSTPLAFVTGKTAYSDTAASSNTLYEYKIAAGNLSADSTQCTGSDLTNFGPFSETRQATTTFVQVQLLSPSPSVTIQGNAPTTQGGQDGNGQITFSWGAVRTSNINYVAEVAFLGTTHTMPTETTCSDTESGNPKDMSNLIAATSTGQSTSTPFTYTNGDGSYFFHWRVKAFNDAGQLVAQSNICDMKITIPPFGGTTTLPPDPPESVTISSVSRETFKITIQFNKPTNTEHCADNPSASPCVSTYRIYRGDGDPNVLNVINEIGAPAGQSNITVTDQVSLSTTNRFYYRISAVSAEGQESTQSLADLTPVELFSSNPPSPINVSDAAVSATSGEDSQVTLTWGQATSTDTKGFVICRSTSTDPATFVTLTDSTVCNDLANPLQAISTVSVSYDPNKSSYVYTDTGNPSAGIAAPVNGTTYFYRIVSVNYADQDPMPSTCTVCNIDNGTQAPGALSGFLSAKPLSSIVPDFDATLTFDLKNCADGGNPGETLCPSGDSQRGFPLVYWQWTNEPVDIYGYEVVRKDGACSGTGGSQVAIVLRGTQPYNFIDTDSAKFNPNGTNSFGKSFCYEIRAFIDADGDGTLSSGDPRNTPSSPTVAGDETVIPFTEATLEAPTIGTLTLGDQQITIDISALSNPPSDLVGYWLFFVEKNPGDAPPADNEFLCNSANLVNSTILSGSLSITHTGLTNGNSYYYKAKAMRYQPNNEQTFANLTSQCTNNTGFSSFTPSLTGGIPQATPQSGTITWDTTDPIVAMSDRLRLQWNLGSIDPATVDHFNVYRATGQNGQKSSFTKITTGTCASPTATTTFCEDTTATDPNIVYYYRITIVNTSNQEGPFSTEQFNSPQSQVLTLLSPENNQTLFIGGGTIGTGGNIIFEWSTVAGADTYKVEAGNAPGLDTATIYYQCVMNVDPQTPAGTILTTQWDGSIGSQCIAEFESTTALSDLPPTLYWRVKAQFKGTEVACSNNCLGQPFNLTQ